MNENITFRKAFDWWSKYRESHWAGFINMIFNLVLACATVWPMLRKICTTIPFTFEANDDSVVQQILEGAFTGKPEAHSIFVKYPLSWIMSGLYRRNPVVKLGSLRLENVNWYLGVIVLLYGLALTGVLFRILSYVKASRILICVLYDLGFLMIWLPCFSRMTFSTAAAFFGCMALLFLAFCSKEEAWRPWNLLILGILLTAAYCLRTQCLYMVLPFLVLEILWKYNVSFFKSVKPWITVTFCGLLLAGLFFWNGKMYGSQEWKRYLIYNHARAYMQDYVGFPDYEDGKDLYKSLGISEEERNAVARYTYCIVDDFSTDWIEDLYANLKKEETGDLRTRAKEAQPTAREFLGESAQTDPDLKKISFYFWILAIPLYILTFLFCLDYKWNKQLIFSLLYRLWDLVCIIGAAFLLWAEWVYLAMNGRFPQRVEEAVRLLTFTVGMMAVGHLLYWWREKRLIYLPVILQLIIVLSLMGSGLADRRLENVKNTQAYYYNYAIEKSEIARYCGEHPDNRYILDTSGLTKGSRPSDDLSQGNWIMTGSWSAYSPLYHEKLKEWGTEKLGKEFVTRKHVYIITKGRKNLAQMMGYPENVEADNEIVDEIETSANTFYIVYRVKGFRKAE